MRIEDNTSSIYDGITVNTPYEDNNKGVKVEDFLQLMIAQLQNQDFMNPVDDTQYVTQLAQFATMQSMQELSHYSQTNYVMSLVGKNVTAATLGLGGAVNKETGIVTKVNMSGDEFTVTINGKEFKLSQIMSINDSATSLPAAELKAANSMDLILKSQSDNCITMRWESPLNDDKKSETLRYDVYYTTDDSLDFYDLESVKKGTLAAQGLSSPEHIVSSLDPGTTYTINVVVRSQDGQEAIYRPKVVTTNAS